MRWVVEDNKMFDMMLMKEIINYVPKSLGFFLNE